MTRVFEGFWSGLAERVRPTGVLQTVEDPRVIVRGVTAGLLGGAVQVFGLSAVFAYFDEISVALAGLGLALIQVGAWIWFAVTGSVFTVGVTVLVGSLAGNVYAHVELGGYAYSGAIFVFGVPIVIAAALLLGRTATVIAGVTYGFIGVILGFFESSLRASRAAPDQTLTTILFVALMVAGINVSAPLVLYFMGRLRHERERAESLLLNVLPSEIAEELKTTGETVPRRYESISVLFADTVGFTPMSASMEPEEVVAQLNEVFTYFDSLAEAHGVEKIRTIGDSYMAASGVPAPRADHAESLAAMALSMMDYADSTPLTFRIGIHSGPVVAGVIGTRKFQYDIWGDTVNTASRMESHGEPGRIQISESTRQLISDAFKTTPRGTIEIKGKGPLQTWWLDAGSPAGRSTA
jgi:adenylate cyclase